MRNTRTTLTRRAAVAAASATAALVLAACGSDGAGGGSGHGGGHSSASSSSTPSATSSSPAGADAASGTHNDQDVAFAQGMIPHHRQALEMAALAAGRASSAQVKDLAARVEEAQDPEIKTMTGWLRSWGQAPSEAGSMPGMDHSGQAGTSGAHDMPGMMDGKDMDRLEKASGAAFDTMFLTLMIEHHEGAVQMAAAQKEKGAYGPARAMADDIVTGQSAEIAEMRKLLGED
ncbi:DUF305 domain-containing protein [Streptomyces sp. NPDC101166]|uniref:DUF305 domain-containing protein n=1 Tax=Streptomyces sp. NPDC101166 TaxID=3366120 RepID=UPI0037F9B7D0